MFLTYLRHELRRRMRQAVVISLGLALGIGLVITVSAASSGVQQAQGKVLRSLYGVGTDVTVTQSPTKGSGNPYSFRVGSGSSGSRSSSSSSFSRNVLTSSSLGSLKDSSVPQIAGEPHVTTAVGGLSLTDLKISGKVTTPGKPGAVGSGSGGPSTKVNSSSFGVDGVDSSVTKIGPLSSGKITSGRTLTTADSDSNVALVSAGYAHQQKLKVGSTIRVAGTKFKIVGIMSVPPTDSSADVYIPLARAQSLASMKNQVNTVYVAADSATNISAVSTEISSLLPKATVTTSSNLASQVTGSLSSAASLASNLGRWLSVAVLAVAFALAALLTMAAVSRRVREFGTLKALGWRSWRIIVQVMGEALVIGLVGGVAGIGLGFLGAGVINAVSPSLTASIGPTGSTGQPAGSSAGQAAASAVHTVSVTLTAPVTVSAILLAVGLAVAGGLLAGGFGGWRAARLRPAAAFQQIA
jgi:ABC-type antimicrobial peptide transport system permease subunit